MDTKCGRKKDANLEAKKDANLDIKNGAKMGIKMAQFWMQIEMQHWM